MSPLGLRRPNEDEQRRMLVSILGAGASVEAGPPTSMQLADEFRMWAFDGRPPATPKCSTPSQATPTSVEELFSAIWDHLCHSLGRTPNVEEVALACLAIHPESRHLVLATPLTKLARPFEGVRPRFVETIELDLLREMLTRWLAVQDDRVDHLYPLVRLESLFPSETLKVFTLNYDLSVEKACAKLGMPFSDGFTDGTLSLNSVPVFTDAGHDLFAEAPVAVHLWQGQERPETPRVEIFKLHGSVNWFEQIPDVGEHSDAYRIYQDVRAITGGGLSSARTVVGPLAKLTQKAGSVFFRAESIGQTPLYFARTVFGTTLKFMPAVPFVRMYELLYRYLRRTSVCIVIGYSFQDEHVNAMIRDAFNRSTSSTPGSTRLNLIVIDLVERRVPFAGLKDPDRIWQIKGAAGKALASPLFRSLIDDLVRKGASTAPHVVQP